jgi:hypothetical protein
MTDLFDAYAPPAGTETVPPQPPPPPSAWAQPEPPKKRGKKVLVVVLAVVVLLVAGGIGGALVATSKSTKHASSSVHDTTTPSADVASYLRHVRARLDGMQTVTEHDASMGSSDACLQAQADLDLMRADVPDRVPYRDVAHLVQKAFDAMDVGMTGCRIGQFSVMVNMNINANEWMSEADAALRRHGRSTD